jgi:hypothetical protein
LKASFITFQIERTILGASPLGFFGERHKERSHSSMLARTAGLLNS